MSWHCLVKKKVVSLTYYWSWDETWWNWLEMQSAVLLTSYWSWDKVTRLYDKKMQCYSHTKVGNQKQCGWQIKNAMSLTNCWLWCHMQRKKTFTHFLFIVGNVMRLPSKGKCSTSHTLVKRWDSVMRLPWQRKIPSCVLLTYCLSWEEMWRDSLEKNKWMSLTSCWSLNEAMRLPGKEKMHYGSHAVGHEKQCDWQKIAISLTACWSW